MGDLALRHDSPLDRNLNEWWTETVTVNIDDVIAFLCDFANRPDDRTGRGDRGSYGYEIWLDNAVHRYVAEIENQERPLGSSRDPSAREEELGPLFLDAAWELSRRGILRPGIRRLTAHAVGDGGKGYSVTAHGRGWLRRRPDGLLQMQPGRLADLFGRLSQRFGPGFLDRAIEASQCYQFGNHFACCAMCGAASESILLALAIRKRGDEASTLRIYQSSQGRRKITEEIVRGATAANAAALRSAIGLLTYWRDEAAHGQHSSISEIEAHEALGRLIRFAQFATDNWTDLVAVRL